MMKKVFSVMVSLTAVLMLCISGVGFAEEAEEVAKVSQEKKSAQVAEDTAAAQPEQPADADDAANTPPAAKATKECDHNADAGVEKES